ncbi:hypothetical protein ABE021_05475 [Sporosarcina gallistercoris]|uniref:hypothetical protein n=1 Tax=Sporosarcina gallistercoris TaxID=2762245 RepID=UPI003D299CCA
MARGNERVACGNERVAGGNDRVARGNNRVKGEIRIPALRFPKCAAKRSPPISLGFELGKEGLVAIMDTGVRK